MLHRLLFLCIFTTTTTNIFAFVHNIPLIYNGYEENSIETLDKQAHLLELKYSQAYSLDKRDTIPLYNNQFNSAYFINISIGTPMQTYLLLLDTGSEMLWIRSKQNISSQSEKSLNISQSLNYALGHVSGSLYSDIVELKNKNTNWSVPNQTFVKVENQDGYIRATVPYDGLLGLSFNNYTTEFPRYPTFFQNLVKFKKVKNAIFGLWLSDTQGQLTLDGYSDSLMQGNITWIPIAVMSGLKFTYFWGIELTSFQMSNDAPILFTVPSYAILDSGASLITLDYSTYHSYFIPKFQSLQTFILHNRTFIPCHLSNRAPDLIFTLHGNPFILTWEDYIVQRRNHCYLGITFFPNTVFPGQITWVLGVLFLKRYYSIYDGNNQQIGLADSINSINNGENFSPNK